MDKILHAYIENSLYNGELWAAMQSGRYWKLRRNGKTQTWKTRPGEFRVPVKCGMYTYGEIITGLTLRLLPIRTGATLTL